MGALPPRLTSDPVSACSSSVCAVGTYIWRLAVFWIPRTFTLSRPGSFSFNLPTTQMSPRYPRLQVWGVSGFALWGQKAPGSSRWDRHVGFRQSRAKPRSTTASIPWKMAKLQVYVPSAHTSQRRPIGISYIPLAGQQLRCLGPASLVFKRAVKLNRASASYD
jgi:hypothetical protein